MGIWELVQALLCNSMAVYLNHPGKKHANWNGGCETQLDRYPRKNKLTSVGIAGLTTCLAIRDNLYSPHGERDTNTYQWILRAVREGIGEGQESHVLLTVTSISCTTASESSQ